MKNKGYITCPRCRGKIGLNDDGLVLDKLGVIFCLLIGLFIIISLLIFIITAINDFSGLFVDAHKSHIKETETY